MSRQRRTRPVSSKTRVENQTLEILEENSEESLLEQREEPVIELDIEIGCPRCDEIMELHSIFDRLVYSCESCSFLLKCG